MTFLDGFGDNNWLWIIVLFFCLCNSGFDFGRWFDDDSLWWIIILLFILFND